MFVRSTNGWIVVVPLLLYGNHIPVSEILPRCFLSRTIDSFLRPGALSEGAQRPSTPRLYSCDKL